MSTSTSRFPLPWNASIAQWWATSAASPLQIQHEILSLAPFFKVPDHRTCKQELVHLSGKNRYLNEISIKATSHTEPSKNNVVLLAGYGAGIGFYFRNFDGLTDKLVNRTDFYALDWLGMGLSSRPKFSVRAKAPAAKITEAESFFLEALEEWREKRKLERITLVAHSLGGYLANPFNKGTTPEATLNTNEPFTTIGAEFADDEDAIKKKPLPFWITMLWDANFSPFSFVRFAGPFGPKLVSAWSGRRFSHIPESQQKLLHDYAYEIFKQKESGEYALAYLLAPGAYARSHLLNAIPTNLPVLMLYGSHDWMDEPAGHQVAAIANAKPGGDLTVIQVPRAGHHCYLDNPEKFDQIVIDFINRPPRKQSLK